MTFKQLSKKQRDIFCWPYSGQYDNIICDGAVRSGKTAAMSVAFILWAMHQYEGCAFAICGKTVASAKRNIIMPLLECVDITSHFAVNYKQSENILTVRGNGHTNRFFVFGGKDESSYMLIQGLTLCGVLFDEVALMPRSFVDQAVARTLSVPTAKLWFNCNPENPMHWFKKEYVDDADGENSRNSLHLHFTMRDNPIMTEDLIEKAERQFTGVFYKRYILGEWVVAEGAVYPQFDKDKHVVNVERVKKGLIAANKKWGGEYYISIDYGTTNPCSMGLWLDTGHGAYRLREYYWNSRETAVQKTDDEYYAELEKLAGGYDIKSVVVDPSAASFITLIRKKGKFRVRPAVNEVLDGIRYTGSLLSQGKILFDESCESIIKEFGLYSWNEKRTDKDAVIKENDHAMDDMRYFCNTILINKPYYKPEPLVKKRSENAIQYNMTGGWNG